MASCRSCGASILWVWTEAGKRMPLDAQPCEDGNIEIVGERETEQGSAPLVRYLKEGEGDLCLLEPPPRYRSHFARCPHAAEHRRP